MLAGLGVRWHFRRNDGHDFGAWQHLLRLGCADAADTVLLANDSVFGPLRPLPPIVEQMQALPLEVWGMVESREMRWHLQSWFLCFSAAGFAAPAIQRVMQQPFDRMTRNEIVLHGELGLGAALQAEGLRWDARWRAPNRRLRRLVPGNPMHLDYLSVVRSGRVPFIKADLLRNNPAAIGWADRWSTLFALPQADGGLPLALVRQALDARPGAPPPRQAAAMRLLYALISADRPDAARALLRRPSPPR